eukprot:m51a1_g3277 hypothetical protein (540) ;mRNA; r:246902-249546
MSVIAQPRLSRHASSAPQPSARSRSPSPVPNLLNFTPRGVEPGRPRSQSSADLAADQSDGPSERQIDLKLHMPVSLAQSLRSGYATLREPVDPDPQHAPAGHPPLWLRPFAIEWKSRAERWLDGVPYDTGAGPLGEAARARNCEEMAAEAGERICRAIDEAAERERLEEELRARERDRLAEESFFRSDTTATDALWAGFLARVSALGTLVFACHVGSRAYGLEVEGSDVDLMAVVALPPSAVLNPLRPPKLTIKNEDSPDFTVIDVSAFCELLASGDSRCVEMLFHERGSHAVVAEGPAWQSLRELRRELLTRAVVRKYLSEVDGQKGLRRLRSLLAKGTEADAARARKLCYILGRHLCLCSRVLDSCAGREFSPRFDPGSDDYAKLMDMRLGSRPVGEVAALVESEFLRLKNRDSALPDALPPTVAAGLNDWVVSRRMEQFADAESLDIHLPQDRALFKCRRPEGFIVSPNDGNITSIAIVAAPLHDVVGMRARDRCPPPKIEGETMIYEAGRLCQLVAEENPNALELLLVDPAAIAL